MAGSPAALAERNMGEADILRVFPPGALSYGAGPRVSETCGLRWREMAERDRAGQATVFGKGGNIVLFSANTWAWST